MILNVKFTFSFNKLYIFYLDITDEKIRELEEQIAYLKINNENYQVLVVGNNNDSMTDKIDQVETFL